MTVSEAGAVGQLLQIADDVRVPWESNCAGEIFVVSESREQGLRIGHFQGDAALAAYVVAMHNAAIAVDPTAAKLIDEPVVPPLTQAMLDQFPALPEYEATWRAIFMEPVMCSGERLTVAVISLDSDGCEALKTLSHARLLALFGTQVDGLVDMINLVVDAVLCHGQSGSFDNFKSPLSGFYLGEARNGLGENRGHILQQAASLTSCFYQECQADSKKTRHDWLQSQLARVAGFIERDTARLSESPDSLSLQLSLESWRQHHKELTDDLSALLSG